MSKVNAFDAPDGASIPALRQPVSAKVAYRQRVVLDQFDRWLSESPDPSGIVEAAGRLLQRFGDDVLLDLLVIAERLGTADAPRWVRTEFDAAVGEFGAALRAHLPDGVRHEAAQVLQLRVLEAERRLADALRDWAQSH